MAKILNSTTDGVGREAGPRVLCKKINDGFNTVARWIELTLGVAFIFAVVLNFITASDRYIFKNPLSAPMKSDFHHGVDDVRWSRRCYLAAPTSTNGCFGDPIAARDPPHSFERRARAGARAHDSADVPIQQIRHSDESHRSSKRFGWLADVICISLRHWVRLDRARDSLAYR